MEAAGGYCRCPVTKDFGIELCRFRRVVMTRCGSLIVREGAHQAIHHVVFAIIALPKLIMRQLMGQYRQQLIALEQLKKIAAKNDVALARVSSKCPRSVHRFAALDKP